MCFKTGKMLSVLIGRENNGSIFCFGSRHRSKKQLLFSTDAVLRQAYFTKRCIKDTSLTRHQDAMYCLLKITISIFGLENHADHTD